VLAAAVIGTLVAITIATTRANRRPRRAQPPEATHRNGRPLPPGWHFPGDPAPARDPAAEARQAKADRDAAAAATTAAAEAERTRKQAEVAAQAAAGTHGTCPRCRRWQPAAEGIVPAHTRGADDGYGWVSCEGEGEAARPPGWTPPQPPQQPRWRPFEKE
jgi:hypothetical protein